MCGIAGFVGSEDKTLLKKMCENIKHRGPDQEGYYTGKDACLGHKRLSILDLSEKGRQPMEYGNYVIVYNGEVYNYADIRKGLEKRGHRFISNTDTEVVLHAFAEYGKKCLSMFNGMFAFAIWNTKNKSLFLARDRLGIKPLYYYLDDGKFVFASEIKAILEDKTIERAINSDALYTYLAFQCTLGEDTIFNGIKKVLPGVCLYFRNGKVSLEKYWDLSMKPSKKPKQKLMKVLRDAVERRLMSDVPLGVFLSGGIDSSTITGLMAGMVEEPVKTFSVGFNEKDDELAEARFVSEHFKTDHQEFIFEPSDVLKTLPEIVWHYDEPLADGGALPTYLMSKEARKKVKVVLVGEGADECFAGYSWHKLASPYLNLLPEKIRKSAYFYLTTYSRRADIRDRFYRLFPDEEQSNCFLNSMLLFETKNLLPNSLLMKVDKTTMAHSIEARVPFLDHEVVEYAAQLPASQKLNGLTGKYAMKKAVRTIVPKRVIERKKHGFLVPLGAWLRGEMREYANQRLLDRDSPVREYYSQESIPRLFEKSFSRFKTIENETLLWRLLVFDVWHGQYFGR